VYPENNRLYRKGLGEKASELIKISDSTFVRREGRQLVQFKSNTEKDSMALHLLNANDGSSVATFNRMKDDEKLPIEFLVEGNFEKALGEYQELIKKDKDDPTIAENNLNGLGYHFLNNEKAKIAQAVFKVNIALYPNSFNVYDSYAEACMKLGENELAIENYQKSIRLDPKNLNAKRMIEKLEKEL
jgi:tetratricopeptide (TPR) repeat protein